MSTNAAKLSTRHSATRTNDDSSAYYKHWSIIQLQDRFEQACAADHYMIADKLHDELMRRAAQQHPISAQQVQS